MKWIGRALLLSASLVVAALVAGVVYEQLSRRTVARDYPPPGRLIEFDGRRSHIHCIGSGSPTVVLESGLGVGGSAGWAEVQRGVSEATRVCAYDRAGTMWSEPRPEPRDAERIASELHQLLATAGERPPYILVGHSFGGHIIRVFNRLYPREAVGLVFVDASHPQQFDRYPSAAREYIEAVESEQPGVGVARLLSTLGAYRAGLPEATSAIAAYLPRTVPWGLLTESAARDAIARQASASGSLGDLPLVVLTAGVGPRYPGLSDEVNDEFYDTWLELQTELATLSSHSTHTIVEGSTHNIPGDAPEAVVMAVREVVEAARPESGAER